MKTRSKKPAQTAGSKKDDQEQNTSATNSLAPSVDKPPHVFVLPKDASPEANIITFPDPASTTPNRYFVCPVRGFFEFTKLTTPKKACRSWLIAPQRELPESSNGQPGGEDVDKRAEEGYVLGKPDLFVATPLDPIFVLLPMLAGGETGSYLTFSDYVFSTENEGLVQLQQLLRQSTFAGLEKTMEKRMQAICDCLDMGGDDDKMYQLSTSKLIAELASKAKEMALNGLPASMEERFVKQALEVPVLSIKREDTNVSLAAEDATHGAQCESVDGAPDKPTDASTLTATVSTAPAEPTPVIADEITNLLRIRTALDFLSVSYLPTSLRRQVQDALKALSSPVDFAPLDKHLEHIAGLKKQAQALRSLSDNISRKRSADEDEDAMDKAEAKRKKKEDEETKKKNTSRGVQQLAKANTSGMKKLSSFFTKAPPKKA